ncbi:uncharacterized protein LOC143853950 [Tasmannia lanceolata]|uniref:uncharacterized protein LOC143853950 n=1 Tax=Tasmannia lanceolata TaxID=3420 RepID=UPI004062C02D
MGGPAAGGTSSSARKAYARRVNAVHTCNKKTKIENEISFSDTDLDNLILPHDDALVITMLMMIGDDRLRPGNSDLFRFSGEVVKVEGQIELPNLVRVVSSAYHQKMKFIMPSRVGEVRGDQPQSRECYAMALKGKNASESLPIELLNLRDEAQVNEPVEDLISIPLYQDNSEKVVQISCSLDSSTWNDLTQFLRDNANVFAWAPADMPSIHPEVSTHKLGVNPTCKPVKQKRRHFSLERQQAIKEEVERLACKCRYGKESQWEVEDLRRIHRFDKAYPKDSYPLPKIDQLIDATAGHELLTFMNAFSGYNQIRMYESDIPRTSFVTDQGTYCYRVMPFGLKNAGATYQRLVNKLFKKQIGRNMEVYVDDMLVKSQSAKDHVSDLKETFQVLREHNMKLNPTKCAFGVGAGKFLGFMVSQRGIEANPEKIKGVVDLTPTKTIREVQRLTGMIAALGHLVLKSAQRCMPFFNVVKGLKTVPWTPECQVAFEELKQYLSSPPLLTKPEPEDELLLFLSKPIYYVSKVLHDAETRYQRVEKLAYALAMAARKLRPYFQARTVKVLTDQPLRQQSISSKTIETLVVEEITIPGGQVEAEAATSVRTEGATVPTEKDMSSEALWEVYVDGLSGCGDGLILTGSENFVLDYALTFGFRASNNEEEYEALIAGMNLKCLRPSDAAYTLQETHAGICGEYLGG